MHIQEGEIRVRDGVSLQVYEFTSEEDRPVSGIRDVVLIHGWPNAGRVWHGFAEALLEWGSYRLFALDLRGYGNSDKPETGYTCARFADDVGEAIAGWGLTRYAVLGHSMGGKIAQILAARRPEGLAALLLLAPVPLIATPVPEEKKAIQREAYGDTEKLRATLAGMTPNVLPPETLDSLVEDGLRASRAAFTGWIDAMREEDFHEELPRITVPTVVYHGALDPLRTEAVIRQQVAEQIAGATLEVLPYVGHLPHLEDPAQLAERAAAFLTAQEEGE
jgi:pimeloyl-ACP methyl ester carboxylesterase